MDLFTTSTLKQVPDATVKPNQRVRRKGEGSEIDDVVKRGNKTAYVENKVTIATLNQRTINQLKYASILAKGNGGTVILNVGRKPTAKEEETLREALGQALPRSVPDKVKIVDTQTGLYDAVTAALK